MKTNTNFFKISAMILLVFLFVSCNKDDEETPPTPGMNYKQEMRDFVQDLSAYAKGLDTNFYIVPQNGHELVTSDGETTGSPATQYLGAIDGAGQEDLYYGYDNDNVATPQVQTDYLVSFLDIASNNGIKVLVTDYCSTPSNMDDSYSKNTTKNYVSFAADQRDLNNIPVYPAQPNNVNTTNIQSLSQAKNFLYLIDPSMCATKLDFINDITATNYDLLIMDLFFQDTIAFTSSEINALKSKANGGTRLIIAYMSIGEAENYRYYWQTAWDTTPPSWMSTENPDWPGNWKVKYWEQAWQDIIFGNNNSYLKKIIDAGFDGAYLDIIDAFEHFE